MAAISGSPVPLAGAEHLPGSGAHDFAGQFRRDDSSAALAGAGAVLIARTSHADDGAGHMTAPVFAC